MPGLSYSLEALKVRSSLNNLELHCLGCWALSHVSGHFQSNSASFTQTFFEIHTLNLRCVHPPQCIVGDTDPASMLVGGRGKKKKKPKAVLKRRRLNQDCPETQANMCMELISYAEHTLKPFNCFQLPSTLWFPVTALYSALHIKMLLWLFKISSRSLSGGLSLHAIIPPSGSIRLKWHSRMHLSPVR